MSKIMGSIAVALAMALGVCGSATAQDNLFKDFAYGSPQKAYTEAEGFYDCTQYVGANALCRDDVDFIDQKFSLALYFSEARLVSVSLVSQFDPDLYASALAALRQSFTLVAMSDGKSHLDVLELKRRWSSNEDYLAKLSRYESAGAKSGNFTFTFFEGVDGSRNYPNMRAMLSASVRNIRAAELLLTGQGADTGVVISFSFPNLEAAKANVAAQKPVHAF